MRIGIVACMVAGCGDNSVPVGPPLEHAETLFVAAHSDDDLIFMQPQVMEALGRSSVATIYAATGDPIKGVAFQRDLQRAARVAYAAAAGITDWECGYVELSVSTVHHCRATDRPVSIIALDITDGGIPGEREESMLHLVDGTIAELPVRGAVGGAVTVESATALFAELFTSIAPAEIHALELAGTHGRDHSSHLFTSAFTLWGAARVGFEGPIVWHRGYNVEFEPVNFAGPDHAAAYRMLGFYEACAYGCGNCGASCASFTESHAVWLQRQYAVERVPTIEGRLASTDGCMTRDLAIADCAGADTFTLARDGQLRTGDTCIAATPDGAVARVACKHEPAQYWVLDADDMLWNGTIPAPETVTNYQHIRCLSNAGGTPGVATCGDMHAPVWRFMQ